MLVENLVDRVFALGGLLVPIVAIIVFGVVAIVKLMHAHQERLAKIERGIDPDGPWPQQRQ
jgi:hypothetical protein